MRYDEGALGIAYDPRSGPADPLQPIERRFEWKP
jgi:hypothetical protein